MSDLKNTIHQWVVDHDDKMSFTIIYVGTAVLLSVFTNLFWVCMLMQVHLAIEIWRHIVMQDKRPILQSLWCVKLDFSILLFALVMALYAEHVFALLGLGQAARAGQALKGAQMITRFGILERGLKVFFLTVDDMGRVMHMLFRHVSLKRAMRKVKPDIEAEHVGEPSLDDGVTKGDIASLVFGGLCIVFILASPFILDTSYAETGRTILQELSPF